jgi:hypothetical protein
VAADYAVSICRATRETFRQTLFPRRRARRARAAHIGPLYAAAPSGNPDIGNPRLPFLGAGRQHRNIGNIMVL